MILLFDYNAVALVHYNFYRIIYAYIIKRSIDFYWYWYLYIMYVRIAEIRRLDG